MIGGRAHYTLVNRLRFLRLLPRRLRTHLRTDDLLVPTGAVGIACAKLGKLVKAWVVPYRGAVLTSGGVSLRQVLEPMGLAPTQLRMLRRSERQHGAHKVVFVAYRPRLETPRRYLTRRKSRRMRS